MQTTRDWPADKLAILRSLCFGARIAEDEADQLSSYFVETDQWNRVFRGDVDIVYGAKGSGKSAMFARLVSQKDLLQDFGVLLIGLEDAHGAPVLGDRPPAVQSDLRALWKLCFLAMLGKRLRERRIGGRAAARVVRELEEAGLLEVSTALPELVRSAWAYVRPGGRTTGRIIFREPTPDEHAQLGLVSVDDLLDLADQALGEHDLRVWLVLDRPDGPFAASEKLESNALRALFRVYLGFRRLRHVSLKLFLRSDTWDRIPERGFRDASTVARELTIAWDASSLWQLIARRLLHNDVIAQRFGTTAEAVLSVVPNGLGTFEWILSMVTDGAGVGGPRELIHIFDAAREAQISRSESGLPAPAGDLLFDLAAFGEALAEVSRTRLEQTTHADHPQHGVYSDGFDEEDRRT
jgi:hypothetical protein